MKWWGRGEDDVSFTHEDKPGLGPFVQRALGLDASRTPSRPPRFDGVQLPEPSLFPEVRTAVEAAGAEVSTEPPDRLTHARGKSLRDLVNHRRGDVGRLPDAVVRPADEGQVEAVLRAAIERRRGTDPVRGGTSISGSLAAAPAERRTVISLDVTGLRRVLAIDAPSNLARIEAGAFGPDIERQLSAQGWTLGHSPDSFTQSTFS